MKVKVYCYQRQDICDLVFEAVDFGVVTIEQYHMVDGEDFFREHWDSLKTYEETLKGKWNKTYIGTI